MILTSSSDSEALDPIPTPKKDSKKKSPKSTSLGSFKYGPQDFEEFFKKRGSEAIGKKFGGVDKLARGLNTSLTKGICKEPNLENRTSVFGVNRTPEPPHASWPALFFDALKDEALIVLVVAAIVALVGGLLEQYLLKKEEQGWIEGVSILVTVLLVASVGATNDWSKDRQFRALKQQTEDRKIRVIRDGEERVISLYDVVVGDLVKLLRGDKIPADGIFISGLEELMVDQSTLTGEPDPVLKDTKDPFLLSNCLVTRGSGLMLVLAVGPKTEWGTILALMEVGEEENTPLQDKLEEVVTLIGKIGTAVAALVFLILLIFYIVANVHPTAIAPCNQTANDRSCAPPDHPYNWSDPQQCFPLCSYPDSQPVPNDSNHIYLPHPWEPSSLMDVLSAFIIAVTIVVVAIPEGLPLAVTISLAYSVKQMLDDQNLVRHLAACEVMGGATTICSDKTGTLTEGKMAVVSAWIAGSNVKDSKKLVSSLQDSSKSTLRSAILDAITLNNDDGELMKATGRPVEFLGSPTECALLVFSERLGANYKDLQARYPPVKKWGFTSARKRMSTVVSKNGSNGNGGSGHRLYCKGAAELVLDLCVGYCGEDGGTRELDEKLSAKLHSQIEKYARQGYRTLTLAYRDMEPDWNKKKESSASSSSVEDAPKRAKPNPHERDLVLLAILAIEDPLRQEVPASVLACQKAGIVIRMVTGDNILTAKKIAADCNIFTKDGLALEGEEFAKMSDEEIKKILPKLQILARSHSTDKLRLVELLLESDEVVAVTGDGTNDAAALNRASVGLAMGIAGTEVAKSAADIIILDDNFASIVSSVLWGRCIYDNIRKFLQFQLTVNIVALVVAFVGAISQHGTPLTAVQLLWVNLIMDTMAALALGTEKPTQNLLKRKPYGKEGKLVTPIMWRNIIAQAIYQLIVLFTILYAVKDGHHLIFNVPSGQPLAANGKASEHYTILFNTFVLCQVFNEINSRKVNKQLNVFEGFFTNWVFIGVIVFTLVVQALIVQFGGAATKTVPLSGMDWLWCFLIAVFSLPMGFIIRLIPVPLEHWEREDWEERI